MKGSDLGRCLTLVAEKLSPGFKDILMKTKRECGAYIAVPHIIKMKEGYLL